MTRLERWNEIAEMPRPKCCGEEMSYSVLHGVSPDEWEAMEDEQRAEAALHIVFICGKCQTEIPIDWSFDWNEATNPKEPEPEPSHEEKLLAVLGRIAAALERANDLAADKPKRQRRQRQVA